MEIPLETLQGRRAWCVGCERSLADPGATDAASLACMPDAFCVQWHRPQLCESDMLESLLAALP